jgi:hypothetical protein
MATNSITWAKASKDYHEKTDGAFVTFGTALSNQLAIDPDVPASGIPAPLTIALYNTSIGNLNTDVVARETSKSTTLTSDEIGKRGIAQHNTDILVNYIDSVCNQKFPGNVNQITTVFARFGLTVTDHGTHHKHIFEVLRADVAEVTLQCPTGGQGAIHHWRWTTTPANAASWKQTKSTHKATVTIKDLPTDVRVYFQYDTTPAVGKGAYPTVSANATDYGWSDSISQLIPSSTSGPSGSSASSL